MDWISFFTAIGRISIEYVWIPLGIWDDCCRAAVRSFTAPGCPATGRALPCLHSFAAFAPAWFSDDAVC